MEKVSRSTEVLQHVDDHDACSNTPCRNAWPEPGVRHPEPEPDKYAEFQHAQATYAAVGAAHDVEHHHCRCWNDREEHQIGGEELSAHGGFELAAKLEEDEEQQQHPDAVERIGDRPGDKAPDLTIHHFAGYQHQLAQYRTAGTFDRPHEQ